MRTDPAVVERIDRFWHKVASARRLSFTVRYWERQQLPEIYKVPYMLLTSTWEISAERPNNISIIGTPQLEYETGSVESGHMTHAFLGDNWCAEISDGRRLLELDYLRRVYRIRNPVKQLNHAATVRPGLELARIFSAEPMAGLVPAARNNSVVPGSYVHTDPKQPKSVFRYTFDGQTGELINVSTWYPIDSDHPQEVERLEFRNWLFDEPIRANTFNTTPPPGYKKEPEHTKQK